MYVVDIFAYYVIEEMRVLFIVILEIWKSDTINQGMIVNAVAILSLYIIHETQKKDPENTRKEGIYIGKRSEREDRSWTQNGSAKHLDGSLNQREIYIQR